MGKEKQPKSFPKEMPENPWIDDVGLIKDRKIHFEVNRMLTCHCEQHEAQATILIDNSYYNAFKKYDDEASDLVKTIYEDYIVRERHMKWGMKKEISIVDFLPEPPRVS